MTRRVGLGPKPLGVLRIEVFEWLEPLGCKIPPPFSFNLSVLGARGSLNIMSSGSLASMAQLMTRDHSRLEI